MKRFFLLVALVATLIPSIFVISEAGGWQNWQGVLPRGTTDSLYYYARMREVVDGHALLGNPYVYEYRNDFAPAFFLPDVISALPMLIGIPFDIGIVINMFFWSFILLLLSFKLFSLLQMPRQWAIIWSILSYLSIYSLMLRPTIMQLVYPLFLAFLIAFLKFLDEPLRRKRVLWLAFAGAFTFYIYTYLSYLVLLSLAFIFFRYLFTRRFEELRSLVKVGIYSALMLIPFGIITYLQMKSPYYFEILSRIGLVYTHAPSIEAILYGRWIVIGLATFLLIKGRDIFWLATGASLLFGLFLNVFSGVEMTLATHIGKFVILWMAIILGWLLYQWNIVKAEETHKVKYIIIIIFLLALSGGVLRNLSRGFSFFEFNNRGLDIAKTQAYGAPLKWLDENIREESVIWANESIGEYIPIMTRHYPLFFEAAALHSVPSYELEDRYLLSRSRSTLTIEDLKRDFIIYAGRGVAKEQPRVKKQDPLTLRGEEYFETLVERFDTIKKNQAALLQQFNVKYLIIDRAHDNLEHVFLNKALYDDGRFVILPLPL